MAFFKKRKPNREKADASYLNAFKTATYVRSANRVTGFIDGILTSVLTAVLCACREHADNPAG